MILHPLPKLSPLSVYYTMSSISLNKKQCDLKWDSLPEEIRLLIFKALMQDGCTLARLATVSREWQTELERHNFARIKLTPSRLVDFSSMIHRNRALVGYIWFCLELDNYDCTKCAPTEEHERHFLSAIQIIVLSPRHSRICSRFSAHGILMAI